VGPAPPFPLRFTTKIFESPGSIGSGSIPVIDPGMTTVISGRFLTIILVIASSCELYNGENSVDVGSIHRFKSNGFPRR
jgi:hypothetical protein